MFSRLLQIVCMTLVCVDCEKAFVCYYGTWATYRQGLGKFDVSNINTELCTHLVYTFVGLATNNTIVSLDPYLDYERDNLRKFNALKEINPNLKTLLAIGGYNEGSAKYSTMAANPTARQTFVKSASSYLLKFGFDGLDFDWEYPNQRDSTNGVADVDNFTQLLKMLKEEFANYNLLLTIAAAAVKQSASLSYDIPAIANYVDHVHLMCYDLHGPYDSVTGHNAGLFEGQGLADTLTVDAAILFWLSQGCPAEKLFLGMPLYGHTFSLRDANANSVGSASNGAGIAGPYTKTNGMLGYNELCVIIQSEQWETRYDSLAQVPYAFLKNNWLSYDDPNSLAIKVQYASKYNLGGVMAWSIETDDFRAQCGGVDFPLLRAIKYNLNAAGTPTSTTTVATTTFSESISSLTSLLTEETAPKTASTRSTSISPSEPTTSTTTPEPTTEFPESTSTSESSSLTTLL